MDLDLSCNHINTKHCWVFYWGPLKGDLLKLLPDDGAKLLVHLPVLPETDFAAEVSGVASAAHFALGGKADLNSFEHKSGKLLYVICHLAD